VLILFSRCLFATLHGLAAVGEARRGSG
jgi:hypothetical protein